jgi:hypothetical protein
MDLPSVIRAIISPAPEKTGFKIDSLKPGDTLQGTILSARKGGRTLVDFGNFRVFAEIKFPIDQGEVLRVTVIESGEQLTLKLIESASQQSGSHKNIRGGRESLTTQSLNKLRSALMSILQKNKRLPPGAKFPSNIKNAMIVIHAHFEPLELESEMLKLLGRLKSQVQASGFFYEKIMENILFHTDKGKSTKTFSNNIGFQTLIKTDLKPNLQILREFFMGQKAVLQNFDKNDVETIKNMAEKLFADVIDQQHKTLVGQQEPDQTQFLTYLLNLKGSGKLSELRVYYAPKKNKNPSGTTRISLLLNMDKMGEIRSDISLFKKELEVNFFVGTDDIKHMIEENLTQIKLSLENLFDNLILRVTVSKAKIADFTQKEVNRITNTKVDIRV